MYNHNLQQADMACNTSSEALASALDKIEKKIKELNCGMYTAKEMRALALLVSIHKPEVLQALLLLAAPKVDYTVKFSKNSQLVEAVEPYLSDNIAVILVAVILILQEK